MKLTNLSRCISLVGLLALSGCRTTPVPPKDDPTSDLEVTLSCFAQLSRVMIEPVLARLKQENDNPQLAALLERVEFSIDPRYESDLGYVRAQDSSISLDLAYIVRVMSDIGPATCLAVGGRQGEAAVTRFLNAGGGSSVSLLDQDDFGARECFADVGAVGVEQDLQDYRAESAYQFAAMSAHADILAWVILHEVAHYVLEHSKHNKQTELEADAWATDVYLALGGNVHFVHYYLRYRSLVERHGGGTTAFGHPAFAEREQLVTERDNEGRWNIETYLYAFPYLSGGMETVGLIVLPANVPEGRYYIVTLMLGEQSVEAAYHHAGGVHYVGFRGEGDGPVTYFVLGDVGKSSTEVQVIVDYEPGSSSQSRLLQVTRAYAASGLATQVLAATPNLGGSQYLVDWNDPKRTRELFERAGTPGLRREPLRRALLQFSDCLTIQYAGYLTGAQSQANAEAGMEGCWGHLDSVEVDELEQLERAATSIAEYDALAGTELDAMNLLFDNANVDPRCIMDMMNELGAAMYGEP